MITLEDCFLAKHWTVSGDDNILWFSWRGHVALNYNILIPPRLKQNLFNRRNGSRNVEKGRKTRKYNQKKLLRTPSSSSPAAITAENPRSTCLQPLTAASASNYLLHKLHFTLLHPAGPHRRTTTSTLSHLRPQTPQHTFSCRSRIMCLFPQDRSIPSQCSL